jgi:hypothetical protein
MDSGGQLAAPPPPLDTITTTVLYHSLPSLCVFSSCLHRPLLTSALYHVTPVWQLRTGTTGSSYPEHQASCQCPLIQANCTPFPQLMVPLALT